LKDVPLFGCNGCPGAGPIQLKRYLENCAHKSGRKCGSHLWHGGGIWMQELCYANWCEITLPSLDTDDFPSLPPSGPTEARNSHTFRSSQQGTCHAHAACSLISTAQHWYATLPMMMNSVAAAKGVGVSCLYLTPSDRSELKKLSTCSTPGMCHTALRYTAAAGSLKPPSSVENTPSSGLPLLTVS
jgi:hypothetical protein